MIKEVQVKNIQEMQITEKNCKKKYTQHYIKPHTQHSTQLITPHNSSHHTTPHHTLNTSHLCYPLHGSSEITILTQRSSLTVTLHG
jgi:hypothetical protein